MSDLSPELNATLADGAIRMTSTVFDSGKNITHMRGQQVVILTRPLVEKMIKLAMEYGSNMALDAMLKLAQAEEQAQKQK